MFFSCHIEHFRGGERREDGEREGDVVVSAISMLIEYVPNLKLVFQVSVNYPCHLIFLVLAEILTEPRLQEIRH